MTLIVDISQENQDQIIIRNKNYFREKPMKVTGKIKWYKPLLIIVAAVAFVLLLPVMVIWKDERDVR